MLEGVEGLRQYKELLKGYTEYATTELKALAGSSYAMLAAAVVRKRGGVHVFVMSDRDAAAYLSNDFYSLLGEQGVLFFPTSYKRSIQYGQEDASGVVQRTAALSALRNFSGGFLVLCTYPEALAEKVVSEETLRRDTLSVGPGDRLSIEIVEETLAGYGFEKVDFVYEPGQYSVRGGIVDVFSYAENKPFRLDFFGDEIESVRSFEIATQLSSAKLGRVEIIPNLRGGGTAGRVSLAAFARDASWWIDEPEYTLKRLDEIRTKVLAELEEPASIDWLVTSRKGLLADIADRRLFLRDDTIPERRAERTLLFHTAPQPRFNKKFEFLVQDIQSHTEQGYTTYILSENRAQIERLGNIFHSMGEKNVVFEPLFLTLHGGYVDNDLKVCLYTDHEIFDRYHRYSLRGEIDRSQSLTVAELNELKVGDYVVHIDHGVGRFGGLVKTTENGRVKEAIKIVYRDNDVLLVNVHALHRIARYKDKDSDPPKVYKLGSGAWQRMKAATKSAVKNIARELIALYARRKASGGFAFSPDGYMQHELEASFIWEDTPDQQQATEAVKKDMESPQPMDRLICGDVGFGKTEVAIRAAFKAVADSKQVAVLVPTTILSLQHYRTFTDRLRDFPVRIETLSRARSAKETKQIVADLAAGKIDILIGTHKILGKDVKFKDLGLLVIDEEQKFGVASKEKLRELSVSVDTLTLTATPIPRTLQFSLMGSRDLSVISTPPPNRQPIATESHLFDEDIIREAVEFELGRGGQVYFVHNRVSDIQQIAGMVQRLCPQARVAVGHGQMNPQELEKLIMNFIYDEYDVLVATTIIENGIDIPNANTIIINNAHHFGLSALHQLRGRVGRSTRKGYCYLLTPPDEMLSDDARRRLRALEEFSDLGSGFNIAMQDLDIRGAGNLLGAEQSGFIADIGFETYQKILAEAVAELRAEGVAGTDQILGEEAVASGGQASFLADCHVETDVPAMFPDDYIGQAAEKLKLYRQLDDMVAEEALVGFEAQLLDRFGPLPEAARELMNVVRLRRACIGLGFERAKVKNGLMILQFVEDTQSAYYKSPLFMGILRYVAQKKDKFVLRQNNNKLALTVRGVRDLHEAWQVLERMRVDTLQERVEEATQSQRG